MKPGPLAVRNNRHPVRILVTTAITVVGAETFVLAGSSVVTEVAFRKRSSAAAWPGVRKQSNVVTASARTSTMTITTAVHVESAATGGIAVMVSAKIPHPIRPIAGAAELYVRPTKHVRMASAYAPGQLGTATGLAATRHQISITVEAVGMSVAMAPLAALAELAHRLAIAVITVTLTLSIFAGHLGVTCAAATAATAVSMDPVAAQQPCVAMARRSVATSVPIHLQTITIAVDATITAKYYSRDVAAWTEAVNASIRLMMGVGPIIPVAVGAQRRRRKVQAGNCGLWLGLLCSRFRWLRWLC